MAWNRIKQTLKKWQGTLIITPCIAGLVIAGSHAGIFSLLEWATLDRFFIIRHREPVDRRIVNVQRMNCDKNLTLALLNYAEGCLSISGQHEETLVVRKDGEIERIDTIDLGFPIGLDDEIADLIS
jgi:hypothetical protein